MSEDTEDILVVVAQGLLGLIGFVLLLALIVAFIVLGAWMLHFARRFMPEWV